MPNRNLPEFKKVRREQDFVGAFLRECCWSGLGAGVQPASDIYDAYALWCSMREDGVPPLCRYAFGKDLKWRGIERLRIEGTAYFRGVALTLDWVARLQKARSEAQGAPA